MSVFGSALDEYLSIRRALGYRLREAGILLPDLVRDLELAGAAHLTTELALNWATKSVGMQPFRWRSRLLMVRSFARYLSTLDPETEVPPADLLSYRRSRPTPYLYSAAEVARLLDAASHLRPALRAATHRTLFGLLAATGLRVGEAIGLDGSDVDLRQGLLTVRTSKFRKSRRVPLHPTTVDALTLYAGQRDGQMPQPAVHSFFVSMAGTRLIYQSVRDVFEELVHRVGLHRRAGSHPPRIHDLRHSFAVNTLLAWYRSDVDVASKLPLLSAYLGHISPASTYWYLEAAPELLALAAGKLERAGAVR